jgi:hypothetical protein
MPVKSKFKMKNYTTDISAERSIAEIETILASFGAQAIMKEYGSDGRVWSLAFTLEDKGFKLPANAGGVQTVLYSGKQDYHGRDSMKNRDERAYRVAWRILKDWIHSQLSLVASGQGVPLQIFFGYLYDGRRTLYQKYVEGKLLTSKKNNEELG